MLSRRKKKTDIKISKIFLSVEYSPVATEIVEVDLTQWEEVGFRVAISAKFKEASRSGGCVS